MWWKGVQETLFFKKYILTGETACYIMKVHVVLKTTCGKPDYNEGMFVLWEMRIKRHLSW